MKYIEGQKSEPVTAIPFKENDEKVIYEMRTNFAQNSKEKKWNYLYELIEKYK